MNEMKVGVKLMKEVRDGGIVVKCGNAEIVNVLYEQINNKLTSIYEPKEAEEMIRKQNNIEKGNIFQHVLCRSYHGQACGKPMGKLK